MENSASKRKIIGGLIHEKIKKQYRNSACCCTDRKNQKQKRIENFIDGLLVWIFAMLTGIAVCNMFGIKVNALPAIAGIVFAVYLSFEAEWKGKLKNMHCLQKFLCDTGASPLS